MGEIILIFVTILALCYYLLIPYVKEGFSISSCPNKLIQRDGKFYLYNSNKAEVPGVNPITFDNLEEYVEFVEWQHSQGIRCPVLFLQNTYNTQGTMSYTVRPSVTNIQAGTPPVDIKPIQYIQQLPVQNTPLLNAATKSDKHADYNKPVSGVSADPMDPNWGGMEYTQDQIDKGVYKGNEVTKVTLQ